MFNRTLNRPMFRRGGRAGGGIMTGVETPRQGYKDPAGSVIQNDSTKIENPTKVQQVGTSMEQFNKAFPSYNNASTDFFMNLGSNILAQPGGQPITQLLGKAGKEPLLQMQKTNMANTQGNRELALKFWQAMDDDDKDAMINRAEQLVDAGRFKTVEEALQVLVPTYRKDQSPAESERESILSQEDDKNKNVDKIEQTYKIGTPDAIKLYDFQKDIINDMTAGAEERKYKLPYDGDQYYIENDDVTRGGDGENRLIIKDYNPEQSDYLDGTIYLDFKTNTVFVKQGQFFIPYTDYISETIQTD
jgi:hypothetical protein